MSKRLVEDIAEDIANRHGLFLAPHSARSVGGGSISQTYYVCSDSKPFFLKVNSLTSLGLFEAEAVGLNALGDGGGPLVPQVRALGSTREAAYLLLDWLELVPASPAAATLMGTQLARLHRNSSSQFGWSTANFIGATPQLNDWHDDWPSFFRERRLLPQLRWAMDKGFLRDRQAPLEKIANRLDTMFSEALRPSLVHGDLWGGNWGAIADGTPVVFDPAVYFGDRETDLAMTRLFGGFAPEFYSAYETEWPLEEGWEDREALYQLYHVLNHVNLFGGSYLPQAERLIHYLTRVLG